MAGVRYVGSTVGGYSPNIYTANATRLDAPSYTVFDASVSYDFGKKSPTLNGLSGKVSVNNLFDNRYVTCLSNTGRQPGAAGYCLFVGTAGFAMPLMHRAGLSGALMAFTALALLALAAGFVRVLPWLAMSGAIAVGAAVSGIFVALSARILGGRVGRSLLPITQFFSPRFWLKG